MSNTFKHHYTNSWSWYVMDQNSKLPISTTKEMLEQVNKISMRTNGKLKKQVNFQSYPKTGSGVMKFEGDRQKLTTTYQRFFAASGDSWASSKIVHDVEVLDPLMNRIPFNQFEMMPSNPSKFMDDHMFNSSQARLRSNFLRQIRNQSFGFTG